VGGGKPTPYIARLLGPAKEKSVPPSINIVTPFAEKKFKTKLPSSVWTKKRSKFSV